MTSALPSLTVAIASHGARVFALTRDALPLGDGWDYLICVQGLDANAFQRASDQLARADITVIAVAGQGVSRNRNAAIAKATGEILLFADDDLTLLTHNYAALCRYFAAEPKVDFICGRVADPQGNLRKRYSETGKAATRFNLGKVGTPELAIRRMRVGSKGLKFDEGFGAGTPLALGDEYIFLADCLRAGLRGRHLDLVLAIHPAESSGTVNTDENFDIRKKVIQRALGPLAWPARLAFALRHRRRFAQWRSVVRFLLP